jgi:hypothetical protein
VQHLDAGGALQHLADEVVERAVAGRGDRHLVGAFFASAIRSLMFFAGNALLATTT